MATKNISRTVIEGGRTGYYKHDVAMRQREERSATRLLLHAVRLDPEMAEEVSDPVRQPVSVSFADKLRPIYRFLDSRVGENWGEVRSEIFRKFDSRTTAGRHILFDHLLREVCDGPLPEKGKYQYRWFNYYVDPQGRLAKAKEKPRFHRQASKPFTEGAKLAAWLGNRKIGQHGARFVWFHPTRGANQVKAIWDPKDKLVYALFVEGRALRELISYPRARFHWEPKDRLVQAAIPYRQARLLDAKDEACFFHYPETVRTLVLSLAPVNVNSEGEMFRPETKPWQVR